MKNEKILIKNGFKKVFPDNVDKEYFYWQKDLKHSYLKRLHIIIDEHIIVYCKVPKYCYSTGQDTAIHLAKVNEKNLTNILEWLQK